MVGITRITLVYDNSGFEPRLRVIFENLHFQPLAHVLDEVGGLLAVGELLLDRDHL